MVSLCARLYTKYITAGGQLEIRQQLANRFFASSSMTHPFRSFRV